MNSGATSERAYETLKRQILAGEFRPGERLDPVTLGEALGVSITPVRDALHILAGEDMVETRTSGGFHMPLISESSLRDLYGWNGQVLLAAVSRWPKRDRVIDQPTATPGLPDQDLDIAQLFDRIARQSTNREHRHAVASNNDRLHTARRAESLILTDLSSEVQSLARAAESDDPPKLRQLLRAYHQRRLRNIAAIFAAIPQ